MTKLTIFCVLLQKSSKTIYNMELNYNANGLVQAVVIDVRSSKILRVGYLNATTIAEMAADGIVRLSSEVGASAVVEAGEYNKPMKLDRIMPNEEKSAVLVYAMPEGSTTGADTFLGDKNVQDLAFLNYLQDFIEKRKREMPEGSYTTKLFTRGVNKIAQKVGEEAVETIIEATNGTKEQFIYESSDLIYHLIVLLTEKGVRIEDLSRELKARHKE